MWAAWGHHRPDLGLSLNDSQGTYSVALSICPLRIRPSEQMLTFINILMPPEIFKSSSWHGTKQHGAQLFLGLSFENVKHKEMWFVIILKWWISVGLYFNGSHCVSHRTSLVKNVLFICWLKLCRHVHVQFIVSKWESLEHYTGRTWSHEVRWKMEDKIRIKKSFLIFIWLGLWPVSVLINILKMQLLHYWLNASGTLHTSYEPGISELRTIYCNQQSEKYFTFTKIFHKMSCQLQLSGDRISSMLVKWFEGCF